VLIGENCTQEADHNFEFLDMEDKTFSIFDVKEGAGLSRTKVSTIS
jgi:hypothetical protein